jgi:hypothetical protein
MPNHSVLLERFKPSAKYDSQEAFFADSVEMMTDGHGCTLRQEAGKVLFGGRGLPALALSLLRDESYGQDSPVADSDRVCLGSKKYRSDYSKLRARRPDLRNRIYARASRGSDGRLWLQYWFAYVYNDYQLAARFGLHEGDWEMIALRMDEREDEPDLAVYAQHAYAEQRDWDDVAKEDGRPVVFIARGSHGSYFEPGMHTTEVFYDIADGGRDAPDLAVEGLNGRDPDWSRWPGIWGATRARWKAESDSPAGPVGHPQWEDPAQMLELAAKRPKGAKLVDAPQPGDGLGARRFGRRLMLEYEASAAPDGHSPVVMVATLNSRQEKDVPPRAFSFDVRGRTRGRLVVPWAELAPENRYDVHLSLVADDGRPTASRTVALDPEKPPVSANFLGEVRLVVHWIRDHVRALFH